MIITDINNHIKNFPLSNKPSCTSRPSSKTCTHSCSSSASSTVSGTPPSAESSSLFLTTTIITSNLSVLRYHPLLARALPQTHVYVPVQQLRLAVFAFLAQFFPLQKVILRHPVLFVRLVCVRLAVIDGSVRHDLADFVADNVFLLFGAFPFNF